MTTLNDADDLTCPRCGASLVGFEGTIEGITKGEQVRVDVECRNCEAPLVIVVESALPEAAGVDLWVEDRREE